MGHAEVFFFALFLTASLGYLALLASFLWALSQKIKFTPDADASSLSVVIPVRNEIAVLADLMAHYADFPRPVIFVNDHSVDATPAELDVLAMQYGARLLHLPEKSSGKKAALHFGIQHADSEWICTSDADTGLDKSFFQGNCTPQSQGIQAVVLPVEPVPSGAMGGPFFDLEFMALQAVGCAAAAQGKPLLASGAAFMFRREAYLNTAHSRYDWNEPSGDDVFLLHAIVGAYGGRAVCTQLPHGGAARAYFPDRIAQLWSQRLRWVGKAHKVEGRWYTFVAVLAVAANAGLFTALIRLMTAGTMQWWAAVAGAKIVGDILLLAWGVLYFRRLDALWWIVPGVILYPFYFFVLLALSFWQKPAWKQRPNERQP